MAKINNLTERTAEPGNAILLGSIAGLLCMIVAVLGIKFKWFKHRLTFDSIPTAASSSVASGSSSSSSPSLLSNGEPQIVRATFRTGDDFDNFIDYTPPKELPPIRINNHRPPVRPMRKPVPPPPIPTTIINNNVEEKNQIHIVSTVEQPLLTKIREPPTRPATPPPPAFKLPVTTTDAVATTVATSSGITYAGATSAGTTSAGATYAVTTSVGTTLATSAGITSAGTISAGTTVATSSTETMTVQRFEHIPMPLSPVIIFTDSPPTPRRIETPSPPPTPILLSPPIIKRHTPPPKFSPYPSQTNLSTISHTSKILTPPPSPLPPQSLQLPPSPPQSPPLPQLPPPSPPPPSSLPIQINQQKESQLILRRDQEQEMPIYAVIQADRKSRNSHQENNIETRDMKINVPNDKSNIQSLKIAENISPMEISPSALPPTLPLSEIRTLPSPTVLQAADTKTLASPTLPLADTKTLPSPTLPLADTKTLPSPQPPPPPYDFHDITTKPAEHFKKMFKKKSKSPGPTSPTHSLPSTPTNSHKNNFLYQVPNIPTTEVPILRHNSSSLENLTIKSTNVSNHPSPPPPPLTIRSMSAIDLDRSSVQSPSPLTINPNDRREKSKSSIFNFSILKSLTSATTTTSSSSTAKESTISTSPQPPERINKEKKKKTKIIRVLKEPKPAKRQNIGVDSTENANSINNTFNQSTERPNTLSLREQSIPLELPINSQQPLAAETGQPVPKQRTKLNLTPVSGKSKDISTYSGHKVMVEQPPPPQPPQRNKKNENKEENMLNKKAQPIIENNKQIIQLNDSGTFDIAADDDSSWNLVAQHRKHTQAMVRAQAVAKNNLLLVETSNNNNNESTMEKNPILIDAGSRSLLEIQQQQHHQQISLLNKPKTMREMRKDQLRNQELKAQETGGGSENVFKLTNGQRNDKKNDESDTDA